MFRKFFWKLFSKNVYLVTCPTNSTLQKLNELNIFPKKKLKLVYDPVLKVSAINMKKKEKLQDKLVGTEFILSIGRLTRQKNFLLLIGAFKEILKEYSNLKLVILGEGEERKKNREINQKVIFK